MPFITCLDSTPTFLGIFDPSVAPTLLYYAYVPVILMSLFLGVYILIKDHFSLKSLYFFLIAVSFSLWVLNIIFQWVIVYANISFFSWRITAIIEVFIPISILYFYHHFIYDKKPPQYLRWLVYITIIGTTSLLATRYNMPSFSVAECQAHIGPLLYVLAFFEILISLILITDCYKFFRKKNITDSKNKQALILGFSSAIFLIVFALSNLFGFITENYQINLVGPIGAVIFIGFVFFMIIRYGLFNIKLIATQALVLGISILIGSQLFSPSSITDEIITSLTLIVFLIAGFYLIRSVKKEITLREQIEIQEKELEVANKGQESLIHIMNHQIKGYLGKARDIFAELLESNDYGEMPKESKVMLATGLKSTADGVEYVQGILKGASARNGTLPYNMAPVDIKTVLSGILSSQKDTAEKAGLSFESNIAEADYNTTGDATQLGEVFKNLITNAIKYNNPNGSIKVDLNRKDQKIIFSVKDAGRGIAEEDKPRLFTAGGMGKDSTKYNVESSGFGLAFVKGVVEKHNGVVGYRSNKPEVGTTFYVELPVVRTS